MGWDGMHFCDCFDPSSWQVDVREGMALETLAAMLETKGEAGRYLEGPLLAPLPLCPLSKRNKRTQENSLSQLCESLS